MSRWFALAITCALAGSATAGTVTPPAGWASDPAAAVSLSKKVVDLPRFGGLRAIVTTEVFRTTGCSLFVTRASASVANLDGPSIDRAANSEANELMRGGQQPKSTKKLDELQRAIEATLSWRDDATGVNAHSRIVVVADSQHIVSVTGECVSGADASKPVETACIAALATLDPGIVKTSRLVLRLPDQPAGSAAREPTPATGSGMQLGGPSLVDSGERPSLPPMQIAPEPREPDRRPVYVGLGLVVLAVLFWWNRKNREKLEREYEHRLGDKPASSDEAASEKPAKPKKSRDGDADDLHAAAAADDGTKESKS